jgi:hypothetical protein
VDIRQSSRLVPTRPILLAMVVLAFVALALTAGYVAAHSTSPRVSGGGATYTTGAGFPGPDARERNQQIEASMAPPEDPTHGH